MSVQMIDCTTGNVAAVLARFGPQQPVAGYRTGPGIEWTDAQFASFLEKIRIAQSADLAVNIATDARVLDGEEFAATPAMWPPWYDSRTDKPRATCYNALFTVPQTIEACERAQIALPPRWWLAWYPDQPGPITVARVLAELKRLTGVELDPESVWAWQYANFPLWDVSRVFGTPDFSRR